MAFGLGVILVAAGLGKRMGTLPKALIEIGGVNMLGRCLGTLSGIENVEAIIVACVPGMADAFRASAGKIDGRVRFIDGGAERQDSVEAAFLAMPPGPKVIAIHDVARPFASAELFKKAAEAAFKDGIAIPVLPVTDTVKVVDNGIVVATPVRASLKNVQTPQCFRRELLGAVIDSWIMDGRPPVTDDASLAERLGLSVSVVDGERSNFKITYPEDLEGFNMEDIKGRASGRLRVGHGYDLHRIIAGGRLVLGGIPFDCGFGLLGHSDADVLTHAVVDAVLGAAAMQDIGRLFPDSDPAFEGMDSLLMLSDAVGRVNLAGYEISNIDCTIIAETPKIASVATKISEKLAACLRIEPSCVSVKGKTNEGLGPEGRGEAISAHAVALLQKVK